MGIPQHWTGQGSGFQQVALGFVRSVLGQSGDIDSQELAALITQALNGEIDTLSGLVDELQVQLDALTDDPGNAVTSLWIPAKQFDYVSGTGASYINFASRLAGWNLPKGAAQDFLACALRLPSHWASMFIDMVWVNTAATTGNVSLIMQIHEWAIGESINVTPTGTSAIPAASATPWLTIATPGATAVPVTPAKIQTLRVSRNGTSGSDTLTNAIGLLGVQLRKAS